MLHYIGIVMFVIRYTPVPRTAAISPASRVQTEELHSIFAYLHYSLQRTNVAIDWLELG